MRALLLLVASILIAPSALAHQPSDAFLSIGMEEAAITGRWDIALRDLDHALGLDGDLDGQLTWGEVRDRQADIGAYALARLELTTRNGRCPTTLETLMVDHRSGESYAALGFSGRCPAPPDWLEVRYGLFFDLDPSHRGLLALTMGGRTTNAVLGPDGDTWRVGQESEPTPIVVRFFTEGVRHIMVGVDHLLFLAVLLLPVACRGGGARSTAWEIAAVVTAFTLAHSITLALAAYGILVLPSGIIESLIALSIVLAALNNVVPFLGRRTSTVAFAFGLVHGLGFASILGDLGPPNLLALFGFNLGIETGQMLIILLCAPLALAARRLEGSRSAFVVRAGSSTVALAGTIWLIERATPWSPLGGVVPLLPML